MVWTLKSGVPILFRNPEFKGETQMSQVSKPSHLLTRLDQVTIVPASTAPFIVNDHFRVDTRPDIAVPISSMDENFERSFLGKVEELMAETKLRPRRASRIGKYDQILKALGGENLAKITLREMHHYLKLADRRESYLFCLESGGVNSSLRLADAGWGDDGWDLRSPYWLDGCGPNELLVARD